MLSTLSFGLVASLLTPGAVAVPASVASYASDPNFRPAPNGTWHNVTAHLLAPDPPRALPQTATANDLRWQPVLDFDTDGCYNVPAIDAAGSIVEGLENSWVGLSEDCRDESDLLNNNVYSRQRCNNGWCVYNYAYYFEKDVALENFLDPGHRHDWEHIQVWVNGDGAQYVAASQHGGFEIRAAADVRWEGERPKIVYHKDGITTHCFRFANAGDDAIENHLGVWFKGDLVSWNGFPGNTRDLLAAHDFGSANWALKESSFQGSLDRGKPEGITFNTGLDEGSPGTP